MTETAASHTEAQYSQNKTPNAFDINKHIRNANEGLCTSEGIKDDVIGILSEITGQPIGREFTMILSGGRLISPNFEKPLVELYAQPTGEPIFDMRAEADIRFIMNLETRMNKPGDFSYLLISPTTEGMSTYSMVEIGQRFGDTLKAKRFSIPHRPFQTADDALQEMFQLAKSFAPEDFRFNERRKENPELVLTSIPIIFDGVNFLGNIESVVSEIDERLSNITGIRHKYGRINTLEVLSDKLKFEQALEIIQNVRDRNGANLIERYVNGCFNGYGLDILQAEFNNIVNNFMKLYEQKGTDLHSLKLNRKYERVVNWRPERFSGITAMCGSIGGRQFMNLGGDRFLADLSRNTDMLPDKAECPHCGAEWRVKNGDTSTYKRMCPRCGQDVVC